MRLSYVDLECLHDRLFVKLVAGQIDVATYICDWDDIVSFCGWTWDEVLTEIDAGWTAPDKKRLPVFLC